MPKVSSYAGFTPVLADLLYGVDDPGGTPISNKMTITALRTLIEANLVQPIITVASANTSALVSTGYSLTGSDTTPMIDLAGTWNTTGLVRAFKLNITNTASDSDSILFELQKDGSHVFVVNRNGVLAGAGSGDGTILIGGRGVNNNHVSIGGVSNEGVTVRALAWYAFGDGANGVHANKDTILWRDAASTFAMRDDTTANTLRVYTTWTDASNYERLALTGAAIAVETAGTGTDNIDLNLTAAGTGTLVYTGGNTGTAGTGTTAVEHGDGYNMVTVLTMAGVLPAIAAGANAYGLLVYTFPAGVHRVKSVHMDVGIDGNETNIDADQPEVGVGSVIATGGVAVLNGTTGFDDYVTETTAANCTGTVTDFSFDTVDAGLTLNIASGEKKMHLNAADSWAGTDTAAALSGTITIEWTFLGA